MKVRYLCPASFSFAMMDATYLMAQTMIINSIRLPMVQDHFHVQLDFDQNAYQQALSHCGYYALLTNKEPQHLSIKDAIPAHKKQYTSEHIYRRAKGPLSIEPIYVHTPERIEAFLLLFKIALQMVVLIERTARKNIRQRDRGLDGFMPNRKVSVIREASTCSKSSKTSSGARCVCPTGTPTALCQNSIHCSAKSCPVSRSPFAGMTTVSCSTQADLQQSGNGSKMNKRHFSKSEIKVLKKGGGLIFLWGLAVYFMKNLSKEF